MIERAGKMFDYVRRCRNKYHQNLFIYWRGEIALAREATKHLDNVEAIYFKSGLTVFLRELDCGIIRGLQRQ